MADRVHKIITPAETIDLLTIDELKLMYGILPADTSQDELLAMLITNYSDVLAAYCNRTFAYEELSEVWRCVDYDHTNAMTRLFLSHYPIDPDYTIVLENPTGSVVMDPSTYEIELKSGKIELLSGSTEPIKVTYAGGYDLPEEAPPALKQAAALMIREGQAMMQRLSVSGIRSISHKESRVQYYDTQAMLAKAASGAGSAIGSTAVSNLLMHYVRLEV